MLNKLFLRKNRTLERIARGAAIGLFFGVSIFWGLQIIFAVMVAHLLKGSRTFALIFTTISNPLTNQYLYLFCYSIGQLIIPNNRPYPNLKEMLTIADFVNLNTSFLWTLFAGTTVIGLIGAIFIYSAIHILGTLFKRSIVILDKKKRWHSQSIIKIIQILNSSYQGITTGHVKHLQTKYGKNILVKYPIGSKIIHAFWDHLNNPIIIVLICSALLSLWIDYDDLFISSLIILAVASLNVFFGAYHEICAGQMVQALSKMIPNNATVLRDGRKTTIPSHELVPGDIVCLVAGDRVPADIRILESNKILIDESDLTGESTPVAKSAHSVTYFTTICNRSCMAYLGTYVKYGTAIGMVVETGDSTELGKIHKIVSDTDHIETVLTSTIRKIGRYIALGILVMSSIILFVGVFREVTNGIPFNMALKNTILYSITLAVGAIPEGLPAIVSITLALGVIRMANNNSIVKKISAVETLGSTTIICSDKTGTLTKNRLEVKEIWIYDPNFNEKELIEASVLCCDTTLDFGRDGKIKIHGDPTEGALLLKATQLGLDIEVLQKKTQRFVTLPFESEHKYMAVLVEGTIIIKGSPEAILDRSSHVNSGLVTQELHRMTELGMRVLAVAQKSWKENTIDHQSIEHDLQFLGLIGMIDPPKQDVVNAVRVSQNAGIMVKMITGDHHKTALAIGQELGLGSIDVLSGEEISSLSDRELEERAFSTHIFARVSPEHKLKLVKTFQKKGHIVAMTGDGVNDAPALRQADVGIAMGISGTAITRETSDIILLDDNFATIEKAIEEGRRVFDNIIKSFIFLIPTNLCFTFLFGVAILFFPFRLESKELLIPMKPIQLLWVSLVTSLLLGIPLALEPAEKDLMTRPPRLAHEPIFGPRIIVRIIIVTLFMAIGTVWVFLNEYYTLIANDMGESFAVQKAQTMAINVVVMFQIFYLFESRSTKKTIFEIPFLSNPLLLLNVSILFILQIGFTHWEWMNNLFATTPLDLSVWPKVIFIGALIIPITMIEKWIEKKFYTNRLLKK